MNVARIAFALLLSFSISALSLQAAEQLIEERSLDELGFQRFWELELDLDRGGAATDAFLVDDTLYVMTDKGSVHAVHAGVGLSRWSQNFTTSAFRVFRPYHFQLENGEMLAVFSTAARTIIVDRYAGDIVGDFPLDKAMSSPTIADATNIYFGSADGHMYAMIWRDTPRHEAVNRWRVMAGGPVTSTPVLTDAGENLVFASQGGSVYSCTAQFKVFNWEFKSNGPIIGDFFVDPSGIYVASTDRSLYRLDAGSGVAEWRVRFPEPLREGPVVMGRTVYLNVPGEGLAAVDADRGTVLWNNADAQHLLCSTVDRIYAMTDRNRILSIDAATGKTLQSITPNAPLIPVRNLADDSIYLVNSRGGILCARPSGTPYLTPDQVESARVDLRKPPVAVGEAAASDEPRPLESKRGVVDLDDPLRSNSDTGAGGVN